MDRPYDLTLNEYADSMDITEMLKSQLPDQQNPEQIKTLLLEIQIMNFYFRKGDLCQDYISDFSAEEWEYIRLRSQENVAPFLRARYAHLFFKHTRHTSQGLTARDFYYQVCENYLVDNPDDDAFSLFCQCLECYVALSIKTNLKIDETKKQVVAYLYDARIPFVWKDHLVEMILRYPKFKKKDLQGLTAFMFSFHPENLGSISMTERFLDTCVRLGQREGIDVKPIYCFLGNNALKYAVSRASDDTGIVPMQALSQALLYFKLGKDKAKEKEAALRLIEQKSKIALATVSVESTAEEAQLMISGMDAMIESLLAQHLVIILRYLIENKNLFDSEEALDQYAKEAIKGSFYQITYVQVYDINNNAKTLKTEADKIAHIKSQKFSIRLQELLYFLDKLFYTGFHRGKLSAANVIQFLNKTWFIVSLSDLKDKETEKTYSWIELIGPGIIHLLSQLEQSYADKNFKPDLVLSIDSLSLKIEGMIRELARISGLVVTKIGQHGPEEMNLDDLLRDETIVKLFYPEDVFLWKFLLTSTGWNIRNNAAHAFFKPKHYTRSKAIVILLAILRLCKYGYLVV